mmetsp:Transcript_269/g.315  ORF Transcript_269/g.315 Transcript_269/m.315 type:complete len:200 (-) Transcript_269:2115-2714(-)
MTPVVSLLVSLFGLSFCCFCCWNGGTNNGGVIHMDVLFGWKSLVSRIDTMIHFCCSSCCGGVQTKLHENVSSPNKNVESFLFHNLPNWMLPYTTFYSCCYFQTIAHTMHRHFVPFPHLLLLSWKKSSFFVFWERWWLLLFHPPPPRWEVYLFWTNHVFWHFFVLFELLHLVLHSSSSSSSNPSFCEKTIPLCLPQTVKQ